MKKFSQCRSSQEGSVALTTALAIVLLVGIAGAAIDLGRQQLLHSRLQQSSDAAALAGALAPTGSTPTDTANRYFALNYAINDAQSYMGTTTTPTISASNGMQVAADGVVQNQFIRMLGNVQTQTKGATTVSTNSTTTAQKYDVVVVMDNSMSMNATDIPVPDGAPGEMESRVQATKDAVGLIANKLLSKNTNADSDSRVGGIGYHWDVDGDRVLNPTSDMLIFQYYMNGMRMGGPPSEGVIGTDSSAGMDVAWNMAATFRPGTVHVVVLLTDGDNNTYREPLGGSPTCGNQICWLAPFISDAYADQSGQEQSDTQTLVDCNKFKNQNPATVVYTIGFGPDAANSPTVNTFLSSCASGTAGGNLGQYFFLAPDAATLNAVFSGIATSVQKMRITQ